MFTQHAAESKFSLQPLEEGRQRHKHRRAKETWPHLGWKATAELQSRD